MKSPREPSLSARRRKRTRHADGQLVWDIGTLGPGEEQMVEVQLHADR